MYQRVLIPLDGSPTAEQVLPFAQAFATRFQSSVVLFRAVEPILDQPQVDGKAFTPAGQGARLEGAARAYLETICYSFSAIHIPAEAQVQVGSPAAAILALAESIPADLIAMATHGRTGLQRWAFGSVADKVLSGARCPLLLARASEEPAASPRIARVLVPLDGSALAERALGPAQHIAKAFDAEVYLFRAWLVPPYLADEFPESLEEAIGKSAEEYLQQAAVGVKEEGVHVRWETRSIMAAEGILKVAQEQAADLIVMSTHGRSGLDRWIMGSVADRVLRASPVPVLLIRSGVTTAPVRAN